MINNINVYYARIFAVFVFIGESFVVATTDKFLPLAIDEFIVATALLVISFTLKREQAPRYFMVVWAFAAGSLYSMLFVRLDPVNGSGERIVLVAVAFVAALIGFVLSCYAQRVSASEKKQNYA